MSDNKSTPTTGAAEEPLTLNSEAQLPEVIRANLSAIIESMYANLTTYAGADEVGNMVGPPIVRSVDDHTAVIRQDDAGRIVGGINANSAVAAMLQAIVDDTIPRSEGVSIPPRLQALYRDGVARLALPRRPGVLRLVIPTRQGVWVGDVDPPSALDAS